MVRRDGTPEDDDLRDEAGHLVDAHGRRQYTLSEEVVRLHHRAVAAGWEHSYDRTPYENLRALLEVVDTDRETVEQFAFRFIAGYGPASTPRALDSLADEGAEP